MEDAFSAVRNFVTSCFIHNDKHVLRLAMFSSTIQQFSYSSSSPFGPTQCDNLILTLLFSSAKIRRQYISAPLPAVLWNFVQYASQKGIQAEIGFTNNQM
jgi:hypothetical protein